MKLNRFNHIKKYFFAVNRKLSLRKIAFFLCLAVFLLSSSFLLTYTIRSAIEQSKFDKLAQTVEQSQSTQLTVSEEAQEYSESSNATEIPTVAVLPEYQTIYEQNNNLVGWITVPGTKVNYPVCYREDDPEFYLSHNYYGNNSPSGVPFVEEPFDEKSNSILVHGHNMKNKTMFGSLYSYEDISFWKDYRTICYDTLYDKQTFTIFAVVKCRIPPNDSDDYRYYQHTGTLSEEDYNTLVDWLIANSKYDTKLTPANGEPIIILSTCSYHTEEGRFLVAGYKNSQSGGDK